MSKEFSEFDAPSLTNEFSEFDSDSLPSVPDMGPNPSLMSLPDDYDQGPSMDFASPESQTHEREMQNRKTLLGKAKSLGIGALSAAPFKEEIGAAAESLIPGKGTVLDRYRKSRDENIKFWEEEKRLGGGYGLAGQIAGSIPSAVLSSALPGGLIAQGAQLGAAAGLDSSDADLTRGQLADAGINSAIGAAIGAGGAIAAPYVGKAIGKVYSAVRHPVATAEKMAGDAAQIPQKAVDFFAEKIGKSSQARRGFGDMKITSDDMKSPAMQALKNLSERQNPQVTAEANTVVAGPSKQQIAAERVLKEDIAQGIKRDLATQEKEASDRAIMSEKQEFESSNRKSMLDAEERRIAEAQKEAQSSGDPNVTNPLIQAQESNRASSDADFERFVVGQRSNGRAPKLTPEQSIDYSNLSPKERSLFVVPRGGKDPVAPRNPAYNRMTTEQMRLDELPDEMLTPSQLSDREDLVRMSILDQERGQMRTGYQTGVNGRSQILPAKNDANAYSDTSVMNKDAKRSDMGKVALEAIRSKSGNQKLQQQMQSINDNIVSRGRTTPKANDQIVSMYEDVDPILRARNETVFQQNSQDPIRNNAEDRLSNIIAGRERLQSLAPKIGAAVGGVTGLATGGLSGAYIGGVAGKSMASNLMSKSDAMGNLGNKITQHALKTLDQPSTLQNLASRNDSVGHIFKWVIGGSPEGISARIYAAQNNPAVREAMKDSD